MGLLRAFIAFELPDALQDAIQRATLSLHAALGDLVRWVPPQNIHLTLKFLGEVSPPSLELIKNILRAEAAKYEPLDVRLEGFGCYPNLQRPRVLWVGLQAPAALSSLQRDLEAATARLGYASEERGFSPHLTIGRVRQNASRSDLQKIRAELEKIKIGDLGKTRLGAIQLFKSDMQPTGSIYTKLFSAALGAAQFRVRDESL